jgi:integrase
MKHLHKLSTTSRAYRIETVVFESGERFPMLVDNESGSPLFDPTVFALSKYRNANEATNTIEQVLRGVMILCLFVDHRGIDLGTRVREGEFLSIDEVDDFGRYAGTPLILINRKPEAQSREASRRMGRQANVLRLMRRLPAAGHLPTVDQNTKAIRLRYTTAYLRWLCQREASHLAAPLEHAAYMERAHEILRALEARIPRVAPRSREAISPEEREELVRVVDPASPNNPWPDPFIRLRNQLIVHWGLGVGLRRGEFLSMTVKQVETQFLRATITRQPDNKRDPRRRQPTTKTKGRVVHLGEALALLTINYIRARAAIPAARRHGFLLIARDGKPMSMSSLTKVFAVLRRKCPKAGKRLSMHVLRHVWNEEFSDLADETSMSNEEERRIRNEAMGWSDHSKTAEKYQRRRTCKKAAEYSLKIQEKFMGQRAKDE